MSTARFAGPVGSMGQRVLQPIVNQQVQHVLGPAPARRGEADEGDDDEDDDQDGERDDVDVLHRSPSGPAGPTPGTSTAG